QAHPQAADPRGEPAPPGGRSAAQVNRKPYKTKRVVLNQFAQSGYHPLNNSMQQVQSGDCHRASTVSPVFVVTRPSLIGTPLNVGGSPRSRRASQPKPEIARRVPAGRPAHARRGWEAPSGAPGFGETNRQESRFAWRKPPVGRGAGMPRANRREPEGRLRGAAFLFPLFFGRTKKRGRRAGAKPRI